MVTLRGPQAGMALKLGMGRRRPGATLEVALSKADRERAVAAWKEARHSKGARSAKRAKKAGRRAQQSAEQPLPTPPVASPPSLPDVSTLSNEYLAACVVEARRRTLAFNDLARGMKQVVEALS